MIVRCGRYGTLMTATTSGAGRRLVARAAAATVSVVDLVSEGRRSCCRRHARVDEAIGQRDERWQLLL